MQVDIFYAVFISLKVSISATFLALFFSLILGSILAIKNFITKDLLITTINSLTAIPPVCAGLICYLIISKNGPFGWIGLLYSPTAMIIAQFIIITPIMTSLITKNLQQDYPSTAEELNSYGASFIDIIKLLILNKYKIYINITLIGFGRAVSEYGAAAIVGGSIDHVTRNMTATIALETSKGNFSLALLLGLVLLGIAFLLSFFSQLQVKN